MTRTSAAVLAFSLCACGSFGSATITLSGAVNETLSLTSENGIQFSGTTDTELLTLSTGNATMNISFGLVASAAPRAVSFAEWDGVGFNPAESTILATPTQFLVSLANRRQPFEIRGTFSGTMKSKAGESAATGAWNAGPRCPGSNWCGRPVSLGAFTLVKLDMPDACPAAVSDEYFMLDASERMTGEVKSDGTVSLTGGTRALECRNDGPATAVSGPGLSDLLCLGEPTSVVVGGCTYETFFLLSPGSGTGVTIAATLVGIPRNDCAPSCVMAFKRE